jgi:hypothetical protein
LPRLKDCLWRRYNKDSLQQIRIRYIRQLRKPHSALKDDFRGKGRNSCAKAPRTEDRHIKRHFEAGQSGPEGFCGMSLTLTQGKKVDFSTRALPPRAPAALRCPSTTSPCICTSPPPTHAHGRGGRSEPAPGLEQAANVSPKIHIQSSLRFISLEPHFSSW